MKIKLAFVALVAFGDAALFHRDRIGNAACPVGTIER
jgi:hypothetical protein